MAGAIVAVSANSALRYEGELSFSPAASPPYTLVAAVGGVVGTVVAPTVAVPSGAPVAAGVSAVVAAVVGAGGKVAVLAEQPASRTAEPRARAAAAATMRETEPDAERGRGP